MTIARGPAQLYDMGSFSDPTKQYRVVLPYDNSVEATCTCPAFFYRTSKASSEGCKHIDEARYQNTLVDNDDAPAGFVPGVATDVNDLAVLMESSLQAALTLGRKMGRMEAKR